MATHSKARQKVNAYVNHWDQAIAQARELLNRAENRVARLKGAIQTFTELRDCGHAFDGPESAYQIIAMTQAVGQKNSQQHSV
jgi:hypothetical protein